MPHRFPKNYGDRGIRERQKSLYQLASLHWVFIKFAERDWRAASLLCMEIDLHTPKTEPTHYLLPLLYGCTKWKVLVTSGNHILQLKSHLVSLLPRFCPSVAFLKNKLLIQCFDRAFCSRFFKCCADTPDLICQDRALKDIKFLTSPRADAREFV